MMEPDSAAGPALALAPARASALATDRESVTGPASGQAAVVAAHQVWKRPTDPR
ncbi:MAG TPA: hypothetical protein VE505_06020 [Vicinamibacterales bacterium]|nr:hypothetical protein [Vicinamibacterales bacterium]